MKRQKNKLVSASPFVIVNSKNWKGKKLHRNIEIHRDSVILNVHFSELGPNGNYRESLKALRVVSRMPTGFFVPKKNTYTPFGFCGYLRLQKTLNTL